MIESVSIKNFKCFKDFGIELGSFNVLIGPNGSGKTAFLQAVCLAAAVEKQSGQTAQAYQTQLGITLGNAAVWRNAPEEIVIAIQPSAWSGPLGDRWLQVWGRTRFYFQIVTGEPTRLGRTERKVPPPGEGEQALGPVACYRFEPRALKTPSELQEFPAEMNESGKGLPTLLNSIWGEERDAFLALEQAFYDRFPEYERVIIKPRKVDKVDKVDGGHEVGQALEFRTRHGEQLPAPAISDGAILSLAFMTLCHHPNPPKVLLVEEPENGVHHASLKDIVGTLQNLSESKGVQVILTTHSPYLLDLVEPKEVRVFWKDADGAVHAKRMSDYPEVERQKKHFMTGEIWTGMSEEEIVTGEKAKE